MEFDLYRDKKGGYLDINTAGKKGRLLFSGIACMMYKE